MNPRTVTGAIATMLTALLLLSGCADRRPRAYSTVIDPDRGWAYEDTVRLVSERTDSAMTLEVDIRHNTDYRYSNIWLEVQVEGRKPDTVNLEVADIYGRWTGTGFGAAYQVSHTVRRNVEIDSGRTVTVRHIMRVDTLRGIERVGVAFVTP